MNKIFKIEDIFHDLNNLHSSVYETVYLHDF